MSDGGKEISTRLPEQLAQRVDDRLDQLYRRHLSLRGDEVASFDTLDAGYHKPVILESEHEWFSICLATLSGRFTAPATTTWRSRSGPSRRSPSTAWRSGAMGLKRHARAGQCRADGRPVPLDRADL